MTLTVGLLNALLGACYTSYGLITIADLKRGYPTMGFSHFGVAWIFMAFTCGPHHFIHGIHLLMEGRVAGPLDLLAVAVGFPAGVAFLTLRVEAVLGGRGDRFIAGTPAWINMLPTMFALYLTALIVGVIDLGIDTRFPWEVLPNLMLVVLYFMIGYFILRTQLRNRPSAGGWSLSGLSLGVVFPTCGLMHGVYALYASSGAYHDVDWHGWIIDWFAVPAAIYFLWVVRELYRQNINDWNRSMIDSVPHTQVIAA